MTNINLDQNEIEVTEDMHAVEIARGVLYEAGVSAEHLCNQLNQIGDMIFKQDKCEPQLVFDKFGVKGLKLLQLLGGAKQILALYDAEKYIVKPAPKNFVPTETKVVLTDK